MNLNGKLAELHFTMHLLRKGYDVFWPIDAGSPVDMVWRAAPGAGWRSAQVKKVYSKGGHPTVNITKRDGALYDASEVDYLAFVDYERGYLWLLRADMHHKGRQLCDYTRVRLTPEWDRHRRKL